MARDRPARARRRFVHASLTLAGLGLLAGCGIPLTPATRSARLHRIGCLLPGTPAQSAPNLDAFRRGLDEHGMAEGQNVALQLRYWEGRVERLPDLAQIVIVAEVGEAGEQVYRRLGFEPASYAPSLIGLPPTD